MKTEEILVTPVLAEVLLKTNSSNRKVTKSHVDFLASQMKSGLYIEDTGESLKFSKTNKMLDGQHRLLAVVKSGRSFKFRIDSDLDDKIFHVIDTGKSRTASDVLSIKGYNDSNCLTATIRFILDLKSNRFTKKGQIKYPNDTIIKYIEANPDIENILKTCHPYYRSFRSLSPSILAGIYHILLEKGHGEQTINNFLEGYSNGLKLSENSPIYQLRVRFINDSMNKTKLRTNDKIMLFIQAWNYYIKGRTVSRLNIPEEFPKII